ncbi:WxL domain-containing protein [Dellaglioa carnosa]|uniref:WxL domain-containing protein n=1 Tax=Dellaglioa carnosa TaxID=2995136 RepID=UPI0022A89551|nr:WxL domain-containing protein [Dellaglioa carnosa]MCZ2493109.1 WxL domain-containing protein [Dellaglioa carnosa]
MKKLLTSTLLSATVLGAGLVASSNVNADDVKEGASTATAVQFVGGTDPIKPVDPTNPTNPTDPGDGGGTGNPGPLSIVYATKDISFGADNKITAAGYSIKAHDDIAVEVGDIRGNNKGWALSVKSDQFSDGATTNPQILEGAVISFEPGSSVVANGGTSLAATTDIVKDTTVGGVPLKADGVVKDGANKGKTQGAGLNVDTIAKDKITLTIPANSAAADVAYKSTLNWTLSDVAVS